MHSVVLSYVTIETYQIGRTDIILTALHLPLSPVRPSIGLIAQQHLGVFFNSGCILSNVILTTPSHVSQSI